MAAYRDCDNEVIGLDAALRYVNQTLVDRVGLVTLSDVAE